MSDNEYPKLCELCSHPIESADDATFWHGYGNCKDITEEMWEEWMEEANRVDGKES